MAEAQAITPQARSTYMNRWLIIAVLAASVTGFVQAQNRVLDLDGTNSFVELPPNIFDDREEANVSGCAASAKPAVILECGGLTPLWISGSSGFGFSSTLIPAMESAVEPAHSKGL